MFWIMSSIGSWLREYVPTYWPSIPYSSSSSLIERMGGPRVTEALLSELTYQMRAAEEREREAEQERRRSTSGGVDYGWLVMSQPKPYSLPEMERLELESLCSRVTPEESSQVMRTFRTALLRRPPVRDMPAILRAVIRQTIDGRLDRKSSDASSSTASSSSWISKSMANLRKLRVNAVSVGSEDSSTDVEMQSCDSAGCGSLDEFRV